MVQCLTLKARPHSVTKRSKAVSFYKTLVPEL